MKDITVQVPDERVGEFYRRFADFIDGAPEAAEVFAAPTTKGEWTVPSWIDWPDAQERMDRLWAAVSVAGRETLRVLIAGALEETPRTFPAAELAAITENPKGVSGVAGVLGQIGHVVKKVQLPRYVPANKQGSPWHYLWDWDGRAYSMAPEVAGLLRRTGA